MRTNKKAIRRVKSKIGKRIQSIRETKGLSRAELSKLCGFHSTAMHHFESGRREPLLSSIQRIAKVLGVTIDELVK